MASRNIGAGGKNLIAANKQKINMLTEILAGGQDTNKLFVHFYGEKLSTHYSLLVKDQPM